MNKDYFWGFDGIRAIAAISVILFHIAPVSIVNLGWIGVDLFFVISGFLITNILLKNRHQPDYFKSFYIRRSLRIFPLYFLVITPLIFANLFFGKSQVNETVPYFLYIQNFTSIKNGYLWGLGHTWSLAIEEQYYLIFPFLIYFLKGKKLTSLIILLILTSIITRTYIAAKGFPIFYQSTMLFTRADSLLLGALLPILFQNFKYDTKRIQNISLQFLLLGLTGLILFLFWQANTFNKESILKDFGNNNLKGNFIGQYKYTFIALLFSGLIGMIAYDESNIIKYLIRILETSWLKYLGTISYGLYLFHYPIHVIYDQIAIKLEIKDHLILGLSIQLFLTFITSHFSWLYFEKPLLKLKNKFHYGNRSIS